MKKLSVILINKNRAFSIEWCLQTVLEQLEPQDELIVIDDSSDDGSHELLAAASDRFTRFITIDSGGNRSRVRNTAAAAATGDVLVFVDGDVIICSGALDKVRRLHEDDSVVGVNGVVYGNNHTPEQLELITHMSIDEFNAAVRADFGTLKKFPEIGDYRTVWPESIVDKTHNWNNYFTSFATATRAAFEEIGGFEEGFTRWGVEDMEFAYRLNPKGDIVVTDEIVCYHHPHGKNAFKNALSNLQNLYLMLDKYRSAEIEMMCACTVQASGMLASMISDMKAYMAEHNDANYRINLKPGEAVMYFPQEGHEQGYIEYMTDGKTETLELFGMALPFVNGKFDRIYLSGAYALMDTSFLAVTLQEALRLGKQVLISRTIPNAPAYTFEQHLGDYTFLFGEVCGIVHSMVWFDRREFDESWYEISWKDGAKVYLSKQITEI